MPRECSACVALLLTAPGLVLIASAVTDSLGVQLRVWAAGCCFVLLSWAPTATAKLLPWQP